MTDETVERTPEIRAREAFAREDSAAGVVVDGVKPIHVLALELIALRDKKDRLDQELKEVVAEMDVVKEPLLKQLQETGVQNVKAGGKTVYLHRQIWAGIGEGVTKEQVIEALEAAGLENYIYQTFNSQTLSAWVREQKEGPDGLPVMPPELAGKLIPREIFEVRVRRS